MCGVVSSGIGAGGVDGDGWGVVSSGGMMCGVVSSGIGVGCVEGDGWGGAPAGAGGAELLREMGLVISTPLGSGRTMLSEERRRTAGVAARSNIIWAIASPFDIVKRFWLLLTMTTLISLL